MATERVYWNDCETKDLIAIWAEDNIQAQLEGCTRNLPVYRDISAEMLKKGHEKSAPACRTKIKKLRAAYKSASDKMKRSGSGRVVCPHYDLLDAVLGNRPEVTPVVNSHLGVEEVEENDEEGGAEGDDGLLPGSSQDEDEDMDQSSDSGTLEMLPSTSHRSFRNAPNPDGHSEEFDQSSSDSVTEISANKTDTDTKSTLDGHSKAKKRKKSKLDTSLAALATQLQEGEQRLLDEFRRDERATRQWNEELLARSHEIEDRRLEKQAEREQQREKLSHENQIGLVNSIMTGFTSIAREMCNNFARPDLARPDFARPHLARPDFARPDLARQNFGQQDFAQQDFSQPQSHSAVPPEEPSYYTFPGQ